MKSRWLSPIREPRLRPGSSLASMRDGRQKTAVEVYFLRGGLLSRLPPEGFPGFCDGLPPLLFEPPERLPPLLLLFLDIAWNLSLRGPGRRGTGRARSCEQPP